MSLFSLTESASCDTFDEHSFCTGKGKRMFKRIFVKESALDTVRKGLFGLDFTEYSHLSALRIEPRAGAERIAVVSGNLPKEQLASAKALEGVLVVADNETFDMWRRYFTVGGDVPSGVS